MPDTELPPKEKEIHRWAAHGLAYTCAVAYADQVTGLGPEEILMPVEGKRWMEVVDEWESSGGRQAAHGVPPGMGEPEPERYPTKQDYFSPWPNGYFLRPEVYIKQNKKKFHPFFFVSRPPPTPLLMLLLMNIFFIDS